MKGGKTKATQAGRMPRRNLDNNIKATQQKKEGVNHGKMQPNINQRYVGNYTQ